MPPAFYLNFWQEQDGVLWCCGEKLSEFEKEEWRDVARRLRPDWTDDEFEKAWAEFVELKKSKKLS